MVQGYERREVVQDPNAASQQSGADSVPLSPVMAPRPSSFARVGEQERELADALGTASVGFGKYIEKKSKQWELDGQMAYMQGKTEDEIVKQGNRYTTAGYMTMKARTAGNQWLQQSLDEIENGDKQLSSEEYQEKLSEQFSTLTEGVAGGDEYTRNLMSTMASDMFPRLVAQQIKSNNSFRQDETYNSYTTMLVSESQRFDPENPEGNDESLLELMDPAMSGLPLDLHRKAVAEATALGLEVDDPKLWNLFGAKEADKVALMASEAGLPPEYLAAHLSVESNGKRYAADGTVLTSSAGAKGEMQVMDGTNTDPGYGVVPAKDDSLDERARVGRDYLAAMMQKYGDPVLASMAYNAGPGAVDEHIAKVGNPALGALSREKFVSSFPAKETRDYVQKINAKLGSPMSKSMTMSKHGAVAEMIKAGFSPAQIKTLSSAWDSYSNRKGNEFNKTRLLNERAILKDAGDTGNYESALDQIQVMKEQNGYDDAWANSMATSAASAINAYEKEYGKTVELQTALSTDRLATLSGDKQEKALLLEQTRISEVVDAQTSMPEDQRAQLKRQQYADVVVRNNVVDKKWAASIEASLTGNLFDKEGKVKPEAAAAYEDYLMLSNMASPGYAAKYLGDAKDIVALAESYDGGGGLSSTQALTVASEIMSRKASNAEFTPPTIKAADVDRMVNSMADKVDSWWLLRASDYKTKGFEVHDYEIEQMKQNPVLKSMLADSFVMHKLRNPNINDKAAAVLARNDVASRSEFAMGNVLVSGKATSIREDMGIAHNSHPTAVNKVMIEYLKQFGPQLWGDKFNDTVQIGGAAPNPGAEIHEVGKTVENVGAWFKGIPGALGASIADSVRGINAMYITYNPDRKGFIVDMYANKERTALMNTPRFIPAKEVGEYANATIFAPQTFAELWLQ